MKAKQFPGTNVVYGANQPEYNPLPAMKLPDGTVITCWELSDEEIETIQKTKCIYFSQLTFNSPLQPVRAQVELSDNLEITE
jgi:hypothetical protein